MRKRFAFTLVWTLCFGLLTAHAQQLPTTLQDQEFWRLITDLSETGGTFPSQFMSNEDSAQFVIPPLKESTKRGGVYVGVGSEQNFTYIAAVQPRIAFIVDIRRDNVFEHLMYKALFELADNRADFISRLFARKRPGGLSTDTSVMSLMTSPSRRPGKIKAPLCCSRICSSTASACALSGTRCSTRIFILAAGTVQMPFAKSISLHSAPRTSPDRAAVKIKNCSARAPTLRFARNSAMSSATRKYGNAG